MNYDRMLAMADALENETETFGFNMGAFVRLPGDGGRVAANREGCDYFAGWVPPCGTTFCIAGHACLMFGEPTSLIDEDEAATILGLDNDQVERLFFDDDGYVSGDENNLLEFITRAEAVAAIRRMVEQDKREHAVVEVEAEELAYA